MRREVLLAYLALCLVVISQQLYSDFSTQADTGVVMVSASDSSAPISVISASRQANLGNGRIKIRLVSGSYTFAANSGKYSASQTKNIRVGNITNLYLQLQPTKHPVFASSIVASENLKLIRLLPFVGPGLGFELGYSFGGPNNSQMTVTITAPSLQNQQEALMWLSGVGVNTSLYSIKYITAPVIL